MRILFIGCVEFSFNALSLLLKLPEAEIVGIATRKEGKFNADFRSLGPISEQFNIPVLFTDERSDDFENFCREQKPDIIYCFGWSFLLPKSIISIPLKGTVGYHPAFLPQNRGRHPIIWALALGLEETASTFFMMDEGADSGPIISQCALAINSDDDAGSLYQKLTNLAVSQIKDFTQELSNNTLVPIIQDASKANYWRKRTARDGQIDWRMSSKSIHNLIRALTHPYVGSHFLHNNIEYKVWKSELGPDTHKNLEPGKIINKDMQNLLVKCGEGTLWLLDCKFNIETEIGEYLSL